MINEISDIKKMVAYRLFKAASVPGFEIDLRRFDNPIISFDDIIDNMMFILIMDTLSKTNLEYKFNGSRYDFITHPQYIRSFCRKYNVNINEKERMTKSLISYVRMNGAGGSEDNRFFEQFLLCLDQLNNSIDRIKGFVDDENTTGYDKEDLHFIYEIEIRSFQIVGSRTPQPNDKEYNEFEKRLSKLLALYKAVYSRVRNGINKEDLSVVLDGLKKIKHEYEMICFDYSIMNEAEFLKLYFDLQYDHFQDLYKEFFNRLSALREDSFVKDKRKRIVYNSLSYYYAETSYNLCFIKHLAEKVSNLKHELSQSGHRKLLYALNELTIKADLFFVEMLPMVIVRERIIDLVFDDDISVDVFISYLDAYYDAMILCSLTRCYLIDDFDQYSNIDVWARFLEEYNNEDHWDTDTSNEELMQICESYYNYMIKSRDETINKMINNGWLNDIEDNMNELDRFMNNGLVILE